MAELILTIISEGLKFIDQAQQDSIKNKIIQLRADYADELGKSSSDIDDARLDSLEFELCDLLKLFGSGLQGSNPKT